jgi:hypothetical protein
LWYDIHIWLFQCRMRCWIEQPIASRVTNGHPENTELSDRVSLQPDSKLTDECEWAADIKACRVNSLDTSCNTNRLEWQAIWKRWLTNSTKLTKLTKLTTRVESKCWEWCQLCQTELAQSFNGTWNIHWFQGWTTLKDRVLNLSQLTVTFKSKHPKRPALTETSFAKDFLWSGKTKRFQSVTPWKCTGRNLNKMWTQRLQYWPAFIFGCGQPVANWFDIWAIHTLFVSVGR